MIKAIVTNIEEKMNKTVSVLKKEYNSLKAGRANPAMLDKIEIEYYGSMTPLNQVGNVSAPEPRILLIQPWDKTSIKAIEKAILVSDLGLNPNNDGVAIRLVIPELTEETRKDLCKKVRRYGEDAKVAVRSIRRDANDKVKALKKDNDISEDELKLAEDEIQKKTDIYIKELENITTSKEKEIMAI